MQVVLWDPRGNTVLRVHPVGAVTTYHRSSPAPYVHIASARPGGSAAVPSRSSPGPRVVVSTLSKRINELASSGDLLGYQQAGTVRKVTKQASRDELDAPSRKQDRRRSVSIDPQMSLPSVWTATFDLNPDEPLLGGGAFAKILRVVERSTGDAYAMKVMNRPNFTMRGIESQIESELEAMRRCVRFGKCQHIVRLCDVAEENDYVYIRLEICSCDLLCFAKSQRNNRLTMNDARVWTQQLLTGLGDLHGLGILHRDIKPENLLCASDGTLKIADFGWCAEVCDAPSTLAGTFQYMAPEVLACRGVQTEGVDVWSAGVTILQLLTGRQLLITYLGPGSTSLTLTDPHQALKVKTSRLLAEIEDRCPPSDEGRPEHVSWRCWDLLRWMLIPEVVLRASVPEALSHPWLQEKSDREAESPSPIGESESHVPNEGVEERHCSPSNSGCMPVLQEEAPVHVPLPPIRSPRHSSRLRLSPSVRRGRESSEHGHARLRTERTPNSSPRRLPSDPASPKPAASPITHLAMSPVIHMAVSPLTRHAPSPLLRTQVSPMPRISTSPVVRAAASPSTRPAGSPSPRPVLKLSTARPVFRLQTGEHRASLAGSVAVIEPVDRLHIRSSSQRAPTELIGASKRGLRRASVAAGEDVRHQVYGLGHGNSQERIGRPVTVLRRRHEVSRSPAPHGHTTPAMSLAGLHRMPGSGSALVPGATHRDALSRTSPPDFHMSTTPGMPMPVGSENNQLDANKTVSGAKSGDVLVRTTVVMHQWPMAVKASTQVTAPAQHRIHVASAPMIADCCRLSPRPYVSVYSTRAPLPALLTPPPATPIPEAFRDVVISRSTRPSTFASAAC